MTKHVVKSHSGQRAPRARKMFVRGACGALVAGVAWTALADVARAAPSPVRAPILSQGLVGLRQGAVGDDVKAVQRALISAGVPLPGGADGQFGPATRAAIVDFQGRKGLTQSGEVDTATASALGLVSTNTGGAPAVTAVSGLQRGAKGDAVKELQQKLSAAGIFVAGGADGDFGPGTSKAVSDYQRWNGLTVSGIVDADTASRLGLTGATSAPVTTDPNPPAPTASSSNPFVGLAQGAKGDLVKQLQTALINAGVNVRGGADGDFGNATKAALSSYQGANGLGVSGVVYEATATKLGLGTATPATPTPPPAPPATATPTAASNPYVGLTNGAKGALVKDLQTALINAGITVRGGADGDFGNATKGALASYQQANGLSASGSVDAATAAKLGLGNAPATPAADPTPPPAASSSNPYVGLAVGAQGDKVKELQSALMDTGLVVRGGADGVFGTATKTALQAFQRVNGINTTGVVTEKGAGILDLGTPAANPAPQPSGYASTAAGYPKKGESSERVRLLQQLMIDWKITVFGGADGSFGNATAAAITKFQQVHGLTVTGTVTQETADKMGLAASSSTSAPPSSSSIVMKRFPIQGQCYYGNTWHAARGGGRLHVGVDIIAAEGKLLYAVVDGTITKQYWDSPGALAGNGLRVAEDNGTYFTYLHMSGFAPGIKVGTKVTAGDVIGFVGNTGSSATAHLHFEIHPGGGAAVNPYPYVKAIDDCGNTTPQYQSSFG